MPSNRAAATGGTGLFAAGVLAGSLLGGGAEAPSTVPDASPELQAAQAAVEEACSSSEPGECLAATQERNRLRQAEAANRIRG